ncbi:hypothetical protein AB0H18_41625, partial [Streptomyces sp. NPDC020766]
MTAHHGITAHPKLVEEVAAAVEGVSGVAFLRPGLADRLRSASARPRPGIGGVPQAGVRMTLPDGAGPWHVEIHVVALRRGGSYPHFLITQERHTWRSRLCASRRRRSAHS